MLFEEDTIFEQLNYYYWFILNLDKLSSYRLS
jgi:hypothetical protein